MQVLGKRHIEMHGSKAQIIREYIDENITKKKHWGRQPHRLVITGLTSKGKQRRKKKT